MNLFFSNIKLHITQPGNRCAEHTHTLIHPYIIDNALVCVWHQHHVTWEYIYSKNYTIPKKWTPRYRTKKELQILDLKFTKSIFHIFRKEVKKIAENVVTFLFTWTGKVVTEWKTVFVFRKRDSDSRIRIPKYPSLSLTQSHCYHTTCSYNKKSYSIFCNFLHLWISVVGSSLV